MCEFKYCKGPQSCFLKDISPCPGVCQPPQPANDNRVRSRGFVDRTALARALVEDRAASSIQTVMRVERISQKMQRAAEVLGQRDKASA